MITQYIPNQPSKVLESDLAGEFPLYIYLSQDKSLLLHSKCINELLIDSRIPKPLKVNDIGISFLLQSGVVPPPRTAYQNIYILGIGDKVFVTTKNGKINLEFSHKFPFMNADRLAQDKMQPDEDLILQMLAEAAVSRTNTSNPSFLFHSAGKDSNSVALALAEAGWQDRVTLVTHKSKGDADESDISAKIAAQLGFKHQVLHETDTLVQLHKPTIDDYFKNIPFPCVDNVTLAYPLYTHQLPELKGANVIFGDGNDSHMISTPDKRQVSVLPIAKWTSKASFVRSFISSESQLNSIIRTPAEWFGMTGLSFKDSQQIFSDSVSVYPYWAGESKLRYGWDIFDYKSDIYSTRAVSEKMIRKLHNFASAYNSRIILPFMDSKVAHYFANMPECYLFDRRTLKNKVILRTLLKDRIGLDSDAIGKKGWTYDSISIVLNNWDWILNEIKQCKLWHQVKTLSVINRLKSTMLANHKYSQKSGRLIYRIYLISAWYNKSKYLN